MTSIARLPVVSLMAVTSLVLSAGCASTAGSSAEPSPVRPATIFSDPSVATMYADVPRTSERRLTQAPAVVLAAVRQLFTANEIPITLDQPSTGRIGNPNFIRSRRFLGKSMVDLFNCGSTITGPNALTYRIFLSLVVTVTAHPAGGSTAAVLVTASAQDVAGGASSDRLNCGSTGMIEQRILATLEAPPAGKSEETTVPRQRERR